MLPPGVIPVLLRASDSDRLVRAGHDLREILRKELLEIAKRAGRIAGRRTVVGFAIDALIDDNHVALRTQHLNDLLQERIALAVERDQVGGPVALAGNNDQPA